MQRGLPPVYRPDARCLILGSFPGERSLADRRYYAHPQNAFWPILAAVWPDIPLPVDYPSRLAWLCDRGLALWDVYAACERSGSLDSSIRQARANDLPGLVARLLGLECVLCNGSVSYRVASQSLAERGLKIVNLPSTSPAHAGMSFVDKLVIWRAALRLDH